MPMREGKQIRMKRIVAVIITIAGLVISSTAGASTFFFGGPVESGFNNAGIEFKVKFRHRHPRKILRLDYHNIPATDGAQTCYVSDASAVEWRVNREGRFHATETIHNRIVHVTGRFRHHNRKIVGTLRVRGPIPGGCPNGDTGTLDYVARKGG